MKREIITTEDGSQSIYIPEMDEHYHSTHGAIQESKHIFIEAGLNKIKKVEINILEFGLGTGLNALLSYDVSIKTNQKINYIGIEKYPLIEQEYKQLYYSLESTIDSASVLQTIHKAEWDKTIQISKQFKLTKINTDFELFSFGNRPAIDLVYFDAFAPNKQRGIWTPQLFQKIYNSCAQDAILVTYCAQGQVRRDLQSVGFVVERIPGPPGKREMIRARKIEEK